MLGIIIGLLIVAIGITMLILYLDSYNKLSVIDIKMTKSKDKINELLKEKYNYMTNFYEEIKKVVTKKNYLKEFNNLNIDKTNIYKLDEILSKEYETMLELKEDNKNLNTKEIKELIKNINNIDEKLIANKKFFNKNNNLLIKNVKGYHKIIAKITGIKVNISFEIKEPTNK